MRPFREPQLPDMTPRRRCSLGGKRRFRDEAQAKEVVMQARFDRRRIARERALYGTVICRRGIRRHECRAYPCSVCGGWHTTSRP